mgnify:CR=1 FL=1
MLEVRGEVLRLHGQQRVESRQQKSYSAVERKVVVEGPGVEEKREQKPSSLPHAQIQPEILKEGEGGPRKVQFARAEKGRAVSF